MLKIYYRKKLLCCLLIFLYVYADAQTGNRVFSGAEMVNFGTISLSTPGGQSWATDRLATPGYFSLTNGATYSNASDANNINGYVKKYGNQAYTFPVGNGTDLRTLRISAPTATTDSYATAWILGNPSGNMDPTGPNAGPHDVTAVTFPIRVVSTVGQWDWQAGVNMGTTGDGVNLMITVSMPDMSAFALASTLRLVGWNGTSWIDLSGMATATGNTENSTMFGYMQAGITAVGIGSIWWVLPLKLTSFTAREQNCHASLNWIATNEENMDRFEIEYSSDGNNYKKTGAIAAKGSISENNYSYSSPLTGNENYFRLKMIGKDGNYTYSAVEYIKASCTGTTDFVTVYPNPVKQGPVNINFSTSFTGSASLVLVDVAGKRLINRGTTVVRGNNNINLEVTALPAGIYFIQLIADDNKHIFQTQKIIKE